MESWGPGRESRVPRGQWQVAQQGSLLLPLVVQQGEEAGAQQEEKRIQVLDLVQGGQLAVEA